MFNQIHIISHPTLIFVPGSKHPPTEETAWRPGQGGFQPSQERQRQRSLGCLAISWRFHGFYGDFMALFFLNMWLTNFSWFIHVFSLWWPHGGFMDFCWCYWWFLIVIWRWTLPVGFFSGSSCFPYSSAPWEYSSMISPPSTGETVNMIGCSWWVSVNSTIAVEKKA